MTWRRRNWLVGLYFFLLAGTAAIVVAHWAELAFIWRRHLLTFVVLVILMAASQVVQAGSFMAFLPGVPTLRLLSLARVWALSALANYAAPFQPGVVARVAYLKSCGVSITDSVLAIWRQLSVSIWISLAGFSLGLWLLPQGLAQALALGALLSFLLIPLLRAGIRNRVESLHRPAWLMRHKVVLAGALGTISRQGVAGVVLQYVIGTLLLMWSYWRFGADIGFGLALVLACAVYLSAFMAVLPGNFGVMEGIYLLGGHITGMSLQESAAIALLLRAGHVVSCLVLAGIPLPRKVTSRA